MYVAALGDIAELYNTDITNLFLAASPEEVMAEVKVFGDYVEKALDVPVKEYIPHECTMSAVTANDATTRIEFTSTAVSGKFTRWFIDDICVTK